MSGVFEWQRSRERSEVGVAEFINGASALEGTEGREGDRWVRRIKSRAKGGKQRIM